MFTTNPGIGLIMHDNCKQLPETNYGGDITKVYAMVTGGNQNVNNPDPRCYLKVSANHPGFYELYVQKRTDYPSCCEWLRSEVMWMAGSNQTASNMWGYAKVTTIIDPSWKFNDLPCLIAYDTKSSPDNYTTPFGIKIVGNRYIIGYHVGGQSSNGQFDAGVVELGVPVEWCVHRNFSNNNSGFLRVYKNGVLILDRTGTANYRLNSGDAPVARIQHGLYKWPWDGEDGQGWGSGNAASNSPIKMYIGNISFWKPTANLATVMAYGGGTTPPPTTNQSPLANAGVNQNILLPATTVTLNGTGNDPDGTIAKYAWAKVSGPAGGIITTPASQSTTITGLAEGVYIFRLTVTDDKGATGSDDVQVAVSSVVIPPIDPPATGTILVNSGSATDKFFTGGSTYKVTTPIAGTTNDALYQDERFGNSKYSIPVANGSYTVNLHFAEIYWTAVGKRLFNVKIEGAQVLTNFDIFKEAGANTALIKSFPVTVTDGVVNIEFITVTDNAAITAIELVPRATVPPVDTTIYISDVVKGSKVIIVNGVSKTIVTATHTFTDGTTKEYDKK